MLILPGGTPRRAVREVDVTLAMAAKVPGRQVTGLPPARRRPLTAREHEIALLAAAGMRNREIARHLHLSVRTVENHLQNAYAKLLVRGRRELRPALGLPTELPRMS